ncbi:MAG: hypothetical protein ACRC35_13050 [Angustibacter sp.]
MVGVFRGTWTMLRRPGLMWGVFAGTAAVTTLVTSLAFVYADSGGNPDQPRGGPGSGNTVASLSQASGMLAGYRDSIQIFGIIALCVAAAVFAGQYSGGTLRNLLVRQPHRLRLLAGTWAAVATFALAAVAIGAVVGGGAALALAGGQGVDTDAWFTADGWRSALETLWHVALAAVGYATLGSALGVLMRASIPAVAIGFGWLFLVEIIISGTVDGLARWLPGQLLQAVASGGTSDIAFGVGVTTAAGYLVVAVASAATSFVRRDVTA